MYESQRRFMAVCVGNRLKIAETGTPSVNLKFLTLYDMANPTEQVNVTLFADLFLTENSFERSVETLEKVFGFTGDDLQEINNNTELFANIEAVLVVDEEEYNGKIYTKVKFINHPSGGFGKKLEDSEAQRLGAQLRNKLKAYHMKNKTGVAAPAPVKRDKPLPASNTNSRSNFEEPPPFNDNDLPF